MQVREFVHTLQPDSAFSGNWPQVKKSPQKRQRAAWSAGGSESTV